MPKSTLSVCMIVRDEETVLRRCLDSLQGIYDELCIVDTGSVDSTGEIIRSYNAKTTIFTACNGADGKIQDFASARNAALQLATGDWVLQIDADEVLQSGHQRIKKHINSAKADQIGVRMISNGAQWVSGRLFRRMPGAHYHSRIHEYLRQDGQFAKDTQIAIENLEFKQGKESASTRNIRLCLLCTEEEPDEARNFHFLGNEYRQLQQFDLAIAAYSRALGLDNFHVGKYHTAYYLAVCHLLTKEWDLAIAAALHACKIDPRYAEAYCLLADIYSSIGKLDFAQQWYSIALTCKRPPPDAMMAVQDWAYGEYPRQRLAQLKQAQ